MENQFVNKIKLSELVTSSQTSGTMSNMLTQDSTKRRATQKNLSFIQHKLDNTSGKPPVVKFSINKSLIRKNLK